MAQTQAYIFLMNLYAGLAMGVIYDIFKFLRKTIKLKSITVICDILYCIIAFAIAAGVLYLTNRLEIRLYTFFGMALGFALYITGFGAIINYIVKKFKKK